MRAYWNGVSTLCSIGIIVSIIILFFVPIIGIIGIIANVMAIGTANKNLAKLDKKEK